MIAHRRASYEACGLKQIKADIEKAVYSRASYEACGLKRLWYIYLGVDSIVGPRMRPVD